MHPIRQIQKHYPQTTIPIYGNNNNNFVLKSIGQNWLQLHTADNLIDTISVPSQLRIAKLYYCVDKQYSMLGKNQYYFIWGSSLWVGVADQYDMELLCQQIDVDCILMSNCVWLNHSCVSNVKLNSHNKSYVNIFTNSYNDIKNNQIQLIHCISPYSNLIKTSTNNLAYIQLDKNTQNLIQYNIQKQTCVTNFQLIQIQAEIQKNTRLLSLHNSNSNTNIKYNQLICMYSRNSLSIYDSRCNTIVMRQILQNCQCAISYRKQTSNIPAILYSQNNNLYQFDMRRAATKRIPFLTHNNYITGCSILCEEYMEGQVQGRKVLMVEDTNGGNYIYRV